MIHGCRGTTGTWPPQKLRADIQLWGRSGPLNPCVVQGSTVLLFAVMKSTYNTVLGWIVSPQNLCECDPVRKQGLCRCDQVKMISILIRREKFGQTQEELHMKMEAKTGVLQLQAKDWQPPTEVRKSLHSTQSLRKSKGAWPCQHLNSDLQNHEKINCWCFKSSSLWCCNKIPRSLLLQYPEESNTSTQYLSILG